MKTIQELEDDITAIQEEKLEILALVKASYGLNKSDAMDEFLRLDKVQEGLEKKLEKLQEDF